MNVLVDQRQTVARIYKDIKGRILSGKLGLRRRLDVEQLARSHKVSVTPVRQALDALAFERLVVSHPTRGYHVALWTQQTLRDLYEWRGMLAWLAARTRMPVESAARPDAASVYADAAQTLLQRLNAGANPELARVAINTDERLRVARLAEPDIISSCEAELDSLADEIRGGTLEKIEAALNAYHRRRADRAAEIRTRAILRALQEDEELDAGV